MTATFTSELAGVDRPDDDGPAQRMLILGASTRAAAHSAVRAGLQPVCADFFGDEDLREVAHVLSTCGNVADLFRSAAGCAPIPWMYTGALENRPRLIERFSCGRPLWGTPAGALEAVRDPLAVQRMLGAAGLPALEARRDIQMPPADGTWMLKPLQGASGRGIGVWDRRAGRSATLREPHYFQQRVEGTPISALYVATVSGTWLVGVARQLIGEKLLNAPPYGYCGSIGPVELSSAMMEQIARMGATLAGRCGLRGLFGADFLSDGRAAWLTEVNPRYTASVEIFEHAYGVPLLDTHRRACNSFRSGAGSNRQSGHGGAPFKRDSPRCTVGKLIVYAERDLAAPRLQHWLPVRDLAGLPSVADRPAEGTRIGRGRPVCTVLAAAADAGACRQKLLERARDLESHLAGHSLS